MNHLNDKLFGLKLSPWDGNSPGGRKDDASPIMNKDEDSLYENTVHNDGSSLPEDSEVSGLEMEDKMGEEEEKHTGFLNDEEMIGEVYLDD